MTFEEAVRIVEATQSAEGWETLTEDDVKKISQANALLAAEYVRVRTRIMPV